MSVLVEIAAERLRQIKAEGWTPEHDDQHVRGEIAAAAACYAASDRVGHAYLLRCRSDRRFISIWSELWPWSPEWWKPTDRRRDLIKAAALIVAEIERLDRADRSKPGREAVL